MLNVLFAFAANGKFSLQSHGLQVYRNSAFKTVLFLQFLDNIKSPYLW